LLFLFAITLSSEYDEHKFKLSGDNMAITDDSFSGEVFTVSRLNREARFILEGSFPLVWIEGEISNFAAPQSGHWYFSLKDATAQVRCAMFRLTNRAISFKPKDGMHIMLKARVSLYEGRGEFQLLAEHMEEVGVGKLRAAFEALKKKLQDEGLFAQDRKKELPPLPTCIGVITSPTGAAIRDILSVLKRRFPAVPVIIYPTQVQGETAAANIVSAIRVANQRKECDVLIISRGGGSLEDLWPFNEEIVARAIFKSEIVTISGVGHEIDFTIADFVADHRAPTPSAAAELVVPDVLEYQQSFERQKLRLFRIIQQTLLGQAKTVAWISKHLQQQHPKRRLAEKSQHLDLCEAALARLMTQHIHSLQNSMRSAKIKLFSNTPAHCIRALNNIFNLKHRDIDNLMKKQVQIQQQALANAAAKLDALSPLATLQRGFSITTKNSLILKTARGVKSGDKINVRLAAGSLDCAVEKVNL
jgi:exodeoxyribonuclease VII large subunit